MSEKEFLPFEDDGSQKYYSSGLYNPAMLGIPNAYSGVTKRNQLAWNKKGVALAYMLVPTLKSAVDVIATNLASVPMLLKDKKGNIVYRSDTSGASENNFLSAIERSYKYYGLPLFQLWATSLLLYGESIIEKVPNHLDEYMALKWLNPLAIQIDLEVVEDKGAFLSPNFNNLYEQKKFIYTGRFSSVTYTEDEVLYSRAFNPLDDIRGYSDALGALSKANVSMEFESFTLAFYANQGHPGVIISPKDKLANQKQVEEWQRQWNEKFRGSNQQFKTHINSFPFDVHTFEILDISKPLEVSKDAETKILRSFRVPPEMIGDTSENSYQFSKESKNAFMQTVVRPLALSISNCINHSGIIKQFDGSESELKFSFDFSEYENVAKTDLDKQDVLERKVKSGGISIGAYQRAIGADVVEGSDDTFMIPQGFVVVKKEAISNPELLPQPNDQSGPDTSSLNQSPRETQSVTEEQESVDFFGSKNLEQIGGFNEFFNKQAMDTPNDDIFGSFKSIPLKYSHINFNTTKEIQKAAKRALEWIEEGKAGDGFTDVGRKRASDLSNTNYQPSPEVVKRMYSYLSRHQSDKQATGFNEGEEGFPSAGRVAYDAWGGDAAYSWSEKIVNQIENADKTEFKKNISVQEIFDLAEQNELTIEKALELLDEFSGEIDET